jgi:cytochrome c-type biogenesis protein CcmH
MIWILCGLVTLVVIAALLWPLLRGTAPAADRALYDMTVFRDQLKELDRDLERGVMTAAEADAARLEIQRRLLAAGRAQPTSVKSDGPGTRAALTAAIAVLVPFMALGIYLAVGSPQFTQKANAPEAQADGHPDGEMSALVEKLAARVHETPEKPEGWSLLARSYRQLQRFPEAADAYKHLMALTPDDADAYAGFGEATTAAGSGLVTADARDAFLHALKLDPTEPRARFYLGLALAQQDKPEAAIAVWRDLTASAPKDAPWLDTVREQMARVAQDAGIMPMSVKPMHALAAFGGQAPQVAPAAAPKEAAAANDPGNPDMSALKGKFSAENLEMIKGMVGGLAARLKDTPDDYDGWMRLGRAYTVLQNMSGAKDAYAHAVKLKPAALAPKLQLADLMARETDFDKPLPADLVNVADDIHALEAKEPDALFILGLDKANKGDAGGARMLWQSALDVLPAETPLRAEITRRLAALHAATKQKPPR